jgi:hypothetical protein
MKSPMGHNPMRIDRNEPHCKVSYGQSRRRNPTPPPSKKNTGWKIKRGADGRPQARKPGAEHDDTRHVR